MATNKTAYIGNIFGAPGPWKVKGKFQAGATQAIKRGEILELSSGNFVPLTSDKAMAATVAIADCEIRSGDLAGYHDIIVPRPGDVFEFTNGAADNPGIGTSLYLTGSQTLTSTAGTNVIAVSFDEGPVPTQGFQSVNPSFDVGTTVRSQGTVRCIVKASCSYYAAIQK